MKTRIGIMSLVVVSAVLVGVAFAQRTEGPRKMLFLVTASEGPGFASAEEAQKVLEKTIIPTFDALIKMENDKKIVAGGLPVGERKFVFILEAASNEEADQMLRALPAWGVFKWQVTPLQSIQGRADIERNFVSEMKKTPK